MSAAYSQVDASGAFLANAILKNGRNEVQIYPISDQNGAIVVELLIKKHELQIDQGIQAISWFNDQPQRKKKNSKRSHGAENGNGHVSVNSLLAVALENGEILVLSPFKDDPVSIISTVDRLVSVTSSATENCFWGLTDAASVVEINCVENSVVKSFQFKNDPSVSKIHHIRYKGKHNSPASQYLVLSSSQAYLVDGSKSRKQLVAEFPAEKAPIAFVQQSRANESLLFVATENSNSISVYNTSESSQKPHLLQCQGAVTGLLVLQDSIVAFSQKGATVFSPELERVAFLRTNFPEVVFENVLATPSGVAGVWYDGNQPRFVHIGELSGDKKVEIDHRNNTEKEESPDITFAATEAAEIANVAPAELFARLLELLTHSKVLKKNVIKLCSSNDSEDNIKETIRLFSHSESCSVLVNNLFGIVSTKVAGDPTRKSSLSIWLKWLLLAHGGYISRQEELSDNLKALQGSLDEGMQMMARLLALQGRLQLLRSQAELRNKIVSDDEQSEDETELEAFNETFNNTTNIEESIVYANGETDDFDSIDKEEEEIVNGTAYDDEE